MAHRPFFLERSHPDVAFLFLAEAAAAEQALAAAQQELEAANVRLREVEGTPKVDEMRVELEERAHPVPHPLTPPLTPPLTSPANSPPDPTPQFPPDPPPRIPPP